MAKVVVIAPLHYTCNEGLQMACLRPGSGAVGVKGKRHI